MKSVRALTVHIMDYGVERGIVLIQDLTDQLVVSAAVYPACPALHTIQYKQHRPAGQHAWDPMEIKTNLFPLKCK